VAHACNPSFSGGTDQEDYSSKPAEANSSRDPILKKAIRKRAGGMAQGVGSEFKPQNQKPKTKTKKPPGDFLLSRELVWDPLA
jgi:hypothetical protein